MPATLKETAEREAREAEDEFEAMGGDPPEVDDAPDEDDQEDDQEEDRKAAEAEGAEGDGGDVQLQTTAEPGEQGIATQEDEEPEYTPPDPSDEEVKTATAALLELKDRVRDYGPERTLSSLVAIVDLEPTLRTPKHWPGEEDDKYHEAPNIGLIGTLLLKGCPKLKVSPREVVFLWRNQEKWESRGVTVRSMTKSFPGRVRFMTGKKAVVEMNYHHFKTLNPLQKLQALYRALRELDEGGASLAPDFVGYYDELELFGPRAFREFVRLENAMDRGKKVDLPHQLSLLDEGDGEAAAA